MSTNTMTSQRRNDGFEPHRGPTTQINVQRRPLPPSPGARSPLPQVSSRLSPPDPKPSTRVLAPPTDAPIRRSLSKEFRTNGRAHTEKLPNTTRNTPLQTRRPPALDTLKAQAYEPVRRGSVPEPPKSGRSFRSSPKESDGLSTLTTNDVERPLTARLSPVADVPPVPSLRASTSIPDIKNMKSAHPNSACTSPRAAPSQFKISPSLPAVGQQAPTTHGHDSFRSAGTTVSSAMYRSSGTERSSVYTDYTNYSDAPDMPDQRDSEEGECAVDDILSMYEAGFADDVVPRLDPMRTSKPKSPSPLGAMEFSSASDPPQVDIKRDDRLSERRKPKPSLKIPAVKEEEEDTIRSPMPAMPGPSPSLALPSSLPSARQETGLRTSAQMIGKGSLDPNSRSAEVPRDRYGFKKSSQCITLDQYDNWDKEYRIYVGRRREKWNQLMRQYGLPIHDPINPEGFPPRSEKLKRFVRKGIPPEWRGAAWFWFAGGPQRMAANPSLYSDLLRRVEAGELSWTDREHIERDLNRTFPENDQFKSDVSGDPRLSSASRSPRLSAGSSNTNAPATGPELPMVGALRRVLRAFAVHDPAIGYCQSLNFLAGMHLLFLNGNEEKSFHLLCILTEEHLPGTHGVSLQGANIDIGVLMSTLKENMPSLWQKLDDSELNPSPAKDHDSSSETSSMRSSIFKGSRSRTKTGAGGGPLPTVSLATTSWFMSCFVGTLPIESCCRVWDVLFYEGSKTLFRVALGVFRFVDQDVQRRQAKSGGTNIDPMEVFQTVQTLPRGLLDANALMEATFGKGMESRGLLSQNTVKARREERREAYRDPHAPPVPDVPGDATSERDVDGLGKNVDGRGRNVGPSASLKRGTSLKRFNTKLKSMGRSKTTAAA
ncbi:MAG: hypothetical protein M1831_006740 [Alyxoria varia]|nr:MAG: hypothetical protein M1831_006740 [Alyxoria varia]